MRKGETIESFIYVNGEKAYQYKDNPNYYITKTGILYSTYVKGAQGRTNINQPRKVAYGQDNDGYYRVVLSSNGKRKYIKIHQMVAEQFIGHVESPNVVNHINGDKHDNRVENLEIITNVENIHHAWKTGLSKKENNPNRIPVIVKDNITGHIKKYGSLEETHHETKLPKRYISEVKNRIIKFGNCLFKKVQDGQKRLDYHIDCYYNGELFKRFESAQEAANFFNKAKNTLSYAYNANYPNRINRYTLTFPNVSTIENTILR